MATHHDNMIFMTTNEDGDNAAMRRIPCTIQTAIYEILGNIQAVNPNGIIAFNISDDFDEIETFGQDSWSSLDKRALHMKHLSGSSRGTASINGQGIKFVLDRLLDNNKTATYTVVGNDNKFYGCEIGHFTYSNWVELDTSSEEFYNYQQCNLKNTRDQVDIGTSIFIPIKKNYTSKLRKLSMCTINKMFNKFYNRLPSLENKIVMFNNKEQLLQPLSKDSIDLDCSLIWDTTNTNTTSCYNELLQINNYKEIKKFFPYLKPLIKLKSVAGSTSGQMKRSDLKSKYCIKKGRLIKENFTIRFSIITVKEARSQLTYYGTSLTDLRGVQVYFGNRCLTPCGIFKHLGGKQGKHGEGGALGKKYGGHERFEVEIKNKNSMLFYLPQDKTNIKPTGRGEKILKFIRFLAELHPTTKNKNKYQPESFTVDDTTVDDTTVDDTTVDDTTVDDTTVVASTGGTTGDPIAHLDSSTTNFIPTNTNFITPTNTNLEEKNIENIKRKSADNLPFGNGENLQWQAENNIDDNSGVQLSISEKEDSDTDSNHSDVTTTVNDSNSSMHHNHHHTPGGYLYIFTLENSLDWVTNDGKQIYKFGKTEDIDKRLNKYQNHHPTRKIKLIKLYRLTEGMGTAEKDILAENQRQGNRYNTDATQTSEYITNLNGIIGVINGFKNSRWTEVSESKWF